MFAICPQPHAWEYLLPSRWPPRPPRNPWLWVLLTVLGLELCALPLRRPRVVVKPPEAEGAVLITTDLGTSPQRRLIPPPGKGDPSWAKAPCDKTWQTEIVGTCWSEQARAKPPCPGGLYEHGGKCYAPITKAQRPPTSLEGEP